MLISDQKLVDNKKYLESVFYDTEKSNQNNIHHSKSASQSLIRVGSCYEKKEARVSGSFLGELNVKNLKFGLNEGKWLFRLITTVQKIIEV